MLARQMMTLVVPLTIIVLAVPLIFQKVPPNGLYGFRTALTTSSDQIWYYANKVLGIALLLAGVLWLVLSRVLPGIIHNGRAALRLTAWVGSASIIAGCVISYVLTYARFRNTSGQRPDGHKLGT